MRIGTVEIQGRAALAPMAGVADRAFRKICVDYGAGYVVGEMVSCKGLCFQDAKSRELLRLDDEERPAAVQLFGDDPDIMARAAVLAMEYRPDVIDINMGCPAPKIAGNHCGSALMREPDLCRRIVQAVARAVPVPVTAKIRKGYGPDCVNAVEVARAVEAGGAAAVTVHGRTRDQMYAPPVDWDIIRAVKEAVGIPVIGNGDIASAADALAMMQATGCDGVMVGRAALGDPWLFAEIKAALAGEELPARPGLAERMAALRRQIYEMCEEKGEWAAMPQARSQAMHYMKGLHGAAALRRYCSMLEHFSDVDTLIEAVYRLQ